MPPVSDLVRDSKLQANVSRNCTIHIYVEAGRNRRRISRQDVWQHEKYLGQGSYGQVWLEECIAGKSIGELRAVKMIRKRPNASTIRDYNRELEAVAKFSNPKVSYQSKFFGVSILSNTS
jgi:hypothetical protein